MANNCGELKIVKIPKYPAMKESKEGGLHLRRLGGQYFEGSDGYYFISANGTPKQFTNFKLKIVARVEMVKLKNIIPHFKVEILQGTEQILFTIAEESYKVMDHFLEKKYPNCHIFTDSDSRAREYFKRFLSIYWNKEILQRSEFIVFGAGENFQKVAHEIFIMAETQIALKKSACRKFVTRNSDALFCRKH